MKKFFTLIICMILVPQMTFASNGSALKGILEEYRYFVTVEWDQKDLVKLEQKKLELYNELDSLMRNGLSEKDISEVTELSESSLLELRSINPEDQEALIEFISKNSSELQGASWNGEVLAALTLISITGAFITWFVIYAVKNNKAFYACVEANNGDEQACYR